MDSPFRFDFEPPRHLPHPLLRLEGIRAGYGERLVLATRDGTYAVETGFGPAKRTPVADAINDWLTAPEPGALNSPRAW